MTKRKTIINNFYTKHLTLFIFSFLLITCSKEIEIEPEIKYNLEVLVTPNEGGTVNPSGGTYSQVVLLN